MKTMLAGRDPLHSAVFRFPCRAFIALLTKLYALRMRSTTLRPIMTYITAAVHLRGAHVWPSGNFTHTTRLSSWRMPMT